MSALYSIVRNLDRVKIRWARPNHIGGVQFIFEDGTFEIIETGSDLEDVEILIKEKMALVNTRWLDR